MSTPPEDAASKEPSDSTGAPDDGQPQSNAENRELGPWFTLLRVAIGNRMPEGPLSPETVPASALAIPVDLTIEHLVQHARKCNNPRCAHVPAPLQVYRRRRPDSIRGAMGIREQVHRTLWTHRNHELVRWVRDRILEANAELVEGISSGTLTTGTRLEEVLDKIGEDGPRVLAAVLWATEFNGKDAELLFRCLVGLIERELPPSPEVVRRADENSDLKLVRSKYRAAIRDRDRAVQTSNRLAHEVELKDRALKKGSTRLGGGAGKVQAVQRRSIDYLQRRLRDTDIASRCEAGWRKATATAGALRRDLREQQNAIGELAAARAALSDACFTQWAIATSCTIAGYRVSHLVFPRRRKVVFVHGCFWHMPVQFRSGSSCHQRGILRTDKSGMLTGMLARFERLLARAGMHS